MSTALPPDDTGDTGVDQALSRSFGFDDDMDQWMRRVANAVRPPAPEELGEIGGFRLVAVVARGGQGTVYRAIEPGTGRTVAVKRLHQEGAGSSAKARFDREAEIVASLRHPGIVTLLARHEVGEQRILIMEWIDGRGIDRWADLTRERSDPPAATRSIVSCFATLADAVAHAHRNGVIHRDLKPSNLLVDEHDQPHVLDFGLALPFGNDVTAITQASGFLGTPSYAAPEQVANRHVDARADVHAVGAMLYRALTGRHPFDEGASLPELFRQIADVDPAPPSRLLPSIGRELSLVCMRALAKEPDRRYQSMEELASDLRRWLGDEPVLAHPNEFGYVLRKSFARHRVAFLLSGVAALTLVIATVVSAMLALSLAAEREALENSRLEEQIAKVAAQAGAEEAMRRFREAERATESALRARDFLQQLFSAMHDAGADGARFSVETTLELARRELALKAESPEIEAELRETLGSAYEEFGDNGNALVEFRRAESLLADRKHRDEDLLARVRMGIGRACAAMNQPREAIAPLELALEWFRTMRDDARIADALRHLATVRTATDGGQVALLLADGAIEAALAAEDDVRFGSAMSTKAIILDELGLGPAATETSRAGVECLRERLPPQHPELARALHNDSFIALQTERYDDAIRVATEALGIRSANFGASSTSGLRTLGILIRAMRGRGDLAEAIALGRAALSAPDIVTAAVGARANVSYHYLRLLEAEDSAADRAEILARTRELIDAVLIEEGPLGQRAMDLLRLRARLILREQGVEAFFAELDSEPARWGSLAGGSAIADGAATLALLAAANEVGTLAPGELAVRVERLRASLTHLLPEDAAARITLPLLLADAREGVGDLLGALAACREANALAVARSGPSASQSRSTAAAIGRLERRLGERQLSSPATQSDLRHSE
jgi:tetratricopeptide (TPR) repeat protein